jgi:hypothetical protein
MIESKGRFCSSDKLKLCFNWRKIEVILISSSNHLSLTTRISVMRELLLVSFLCFAGAGYLLHEGKSESKETTVPDAWNIWDGENPQGKTWAKLGPNGFIRIEPKSGRTEKTNSLMIHCDGNGYRGCGLNWHGWYPEDAVTNVSKFNALIFWIRQDTKVESADLKIELVDNVQNAKENPSSNAVSIIQDGGIARISGDWQKVVLPLERFTSGKSLNLQRLWAIHFSNHGNDPLTFHIDGICFTNETISGSRFPKTSSYKATARVLTNEKSYPIRDEIYGVCELPKEKLIEFGIPITRWGGNTSSRYNWKLNVDNGASDWYFKNRGKLITDLLDNGYLKHIQTNQSFAATTYQTIPMLGWVAKDNSSYSFPVEKLGQQKATEPGHNDVGNGQKPDGTPLINRDPKTTSVEAPPAFIGEAVNLVVKHAGNAKGSSGKSGVKYWVLDNEPMLWHETHRDVHPKPVGYDELWQRTRDYASAIKKEDPTAKVAGFCSWGWTDLFYSAADEGGNRYRTQPDSRAHGNIPLAEWFIRKCADHRKTHNTPLVDVFDFHWYPQSQIKGKTPYNGTGMDLALNELRLRSTRDLWDPNYEQESWIKDASGKDKPTKVIRRVREWIDQNNPGMQICLGEYNFGGADNITGGLAQAEVFGIFAQEKVDLAFIWNKPEGSQFAAWQLFRNYDGKKSHFGNHFIPSESNNSHLAVYSAKREDGALTVVVINKNLGGECELQLDLPGIKGKLAVYRFDQGTNNKVLEVAKENKPIDGVIEMKLPAASATMLVVK